MLCSSPIELTKLISKGVMGERKDIDKMERRCKIVDVQDLARELMEARKKEEACRPKAGTKPAGY